MCNVKGKDETGRTPLHYAALHGDVPQTRALLKGGANPNAKDIHGRTPLHEAALASVTKGDIINMLLDAGADINAQEEGGNTPLHCAAMLTKRLLVDALLQRGARVDIQNGAGSTAEQSAWVVARGAGAVADDLARHAKRGG